MHDFSFETIFESLLVLPLVALPRDITIGRPGELRVEPRPLDTTLSSLTEVSVERPNYSLVWAQLVKLECSYSSLRGNPSGNVLSFDI